MKKKKIYYCLVDNNNKPDFRYIFATKKDAELKQKQLQNSSKGETLFISSHKNDFFIDGIKKKFINSNRQIKSGCWTTLKPKKVALIDTITPKTYFKEIISETIQPSPLQINSKYTLKNKKPLLSPVLIKPKSTKNISSAKPRQSTIKKINFNKIFQNLSQPSQLNLSAYNSFFKTKLFTFNAIIILLICCTVIIYNQHLSNKKIALKLIQQEQELKKRKLAMNPPVTVLGKTTEKTTSPKADNIDSIVFNTLAKFEKIKSNQLEASIKKMVAGSPMEKMAPYIAKKDKTVAAFLVGIAKKESNYGRRVPILNGKDCYNYWGYRGKRKRMGSGGHTCFDSPEDAVKTVGDRIERLVKSGVDTPKEMVLWKCGSNCNATGGWAAANKWIKDVNMYYTKMLNTAEEKI